MKNVTRPYCAFLLLLSLTRYVATTASGQAAIESEQSFNTKTSEHAGVAVVASVAKTPARDGKVLLKITITNKTSAMVAYDDYVGFPKCTVSIIDEKGQVQPLTPFGERAVMGVGSLRMLVISLAPAESKTYRCDLRKCFALMPGKFDVSIAFPLRQPRGVLKIEKLRFTINNSEA